ncbi:sensor histidine kinase [Kordiimonas aestuarii]|uniref:sensor histidine kinase n=1 Tax=Kordiimonas aestuarii TaxID=1005925 RepID=UPI0021D2AF4C|nr:HAMP domain-containing sensor histidine kinase [Kordiimonas aestuarii]
MFSNLWHPTLLLFLGTASLPVLLYRRRKTFAFIDSGYRAIFWGAATVAFAAFIDYAEELPWGQASLAFLMGRPRLEGEWLPFIYFPGIVLAGAGIVQWLPAVHTVALEVRRREAAEDELKGLVAEMRNLAVRAEEASRSKAEFLATMGHELRTPLNAVIGFTEMLQQDPKCTPEKYQEYLDIVANSGRHLLSVINDILDMSRLEAGKMLAEPTLFDLDEVVDECIAFHRRTIDNKEINIRLACEVGEVCSDRRMTKQVVLNILSNAIKFTPRCGEVGISASLRGGGFALMISDSGVGMTEKELAQAMKPFVQVDTRMARLYDGTGLGLPIVEKFCALLGGRMEIDSVKWQGTKVTIELPRLTGKEKTALAEAV